MLLFTTYQEYQYNNAISTIDSLQNHHEKSGGYTLCQHFCLIYGQNNVSKTLGTTIISFWKWLVALEPFIVKYFTQ